VHEIGFIYKITATCYFLTGFMNCRVKKEEFHIGTYHDFSLLYYSIE